MHKNEAMLLVEEDPFDAPERHDNFPPHPKVWRIVRSKEFYCRAHQDTEGVWRDLMGNMLPGVLEIVHEPLRRTRASR